jgi:outer membrane autotransporter protein
VGYGPCFRTPRRAVVVGGVLVALTPCLSGPAIANCDIHAPLSGQTVTCTTLPPNPDPVSVEAAPGSTNVTVNVQPSAGITVNAASNIRMIDLSRVNNQGTLVNTSALNFDGITVQGSGNIVFNSGTITTSGDQSEGIITDGGNNNTIVNQATGTITTTGASGGMVAFGGSGNSLTNQGTITVSGVGSAAMGALGDGNMVTNSGTLTVSGAFGAGMFLNGANHQGINTGTITTTGQNAAGLVITAINGVGVNSGTITSLGPQAQGAFVAGDHTSLTNSGSISANGANADALLYNGTNLAFTNLAGGVVVSQQSIALNAGGTTNITINNAGTLTAVPGLAVAIGPGNNMLTNAATGTINGNILGTVAANNTVNNAGAINGSITFGAGDDTFIQSGGAIGGSVNLGDGANVVSLSGGSVGGSVLLGAGNGTYNQSGGSVAGNVTLGTGNGSFSLAGGTIGGNVALGDGNNRFTQSGGAIGGSVNLGNGANVASVSGGSIAGSLTTGAGADQLTWSGGTITLGFSLGAGNDTAAFNNLTNANFSAGAIYTGGSGVDRLTLSNVSVTGVGLLTQWESIALTNGSRVTLDGNGLTLGDAGTGTGTVSIDASSTLFAGNGVNATIAPFIAGQQVTLTNGGTIDLTNGGAVAANSLTIVGNYVGAGGSLKLRSVLGGDGSPSDKLVISGGSAIGSTTLGVTNAGGGGALTSGNGILVVQAINGATTAPGAFSLARPLEAGAYSYLLFRGGVGSNAPQDWFLRSTLDCSLAPNVPNCASATVPNLRPAVPVYSSMPPLALQYGFSLLGTLHERLGVSRFELQAAPLPQGDGGPGERLMSQESPYGVSGVWGRLLGETGGRANNDFANRGPDYNWTFAGFQAGLDLFRREDADGARDHAGLYGAVGHINGNVQQAISSGQTAGTVTMEAYSLGVYLTHIGQRGWYVDAVFQGTLYSANDLSISGATLNTNGAGLATSLEGAYPLMLRPDLVIEPQAQLAYQLVGFNGGSDGVAQISFPNSRSLIGRAGARLIKSWSLGEQPELRQPLSTWLTANVLHEFLDNTATTFAGLAGNDAVTFTTPLVGTWAKVAIGVSGRLGPHTSLFAAGSYQHNIDGQQQYAWSGRLGVTHQW